MTLLSHLLRSRVLVAAVLDDAAQAVPLARALLAGGLDLMEVTFRHPCAAECVRRIRAEVPEMNVGAGTLLSARQIDEARAAGATFGVTPGFNPTVVRHAVRERFAFLPAAFTPGEMEQAMELGCPLVKLFPASSGGPDFVRALAAPYAHTPLRLVPFGGVNENNLGQYLGLPLVVAVGGSWLGDRTLVAEGNWQEITGRTRRTLALAQFPERK